MFALLRLDGSLRGPKSLPDMLLFGGDPIVNFDASEWFEGAPVSDGGATTTSQDGLDAWLDGAPVVNR